MFQAASNFINHLAGNFLLEGLELLQTVQYLVDFVGWELDCVRFALTVHPKISFTVAQRPS